MKKSPLKKKTPLKNRGAKLKKNRVLKKKGVVSRKRNIAKKVTRRKGSPLANEIIKCDLVFSQYIRLSHADKRGLVKCYTCDFKSFWKQSGIECGHFMGRANKSTRWLKINCKPQCTNCNAYQKGNLVVFAERLTKEYGENIISYLKSEANKKEALTAIKVRTLRNYFESQVVKLKERLEI